MALCCWLKPQLMGTYTSSTTQLDYSTLLSFRTRASFSIKIEETRQLTNAYSTVTTNNSVVLLCAAADLKHIYTSA